MSSESGGSFLTGIPQAASSQLVSSELGSTSTFHRLRHAAVNQVYAATNDILLTQRFARHSSLLVTAVHLHPTDDDLAESIRDVIC